MKDLPPYPSALVHDAEADVSVSSLDDRRRIKSLEAQVADLEAKLARASGRVEPALEKIVSDECHHLVGFFVSDHDMEVTCKACGKPMDPYVVLRKIAHREVNFAYTSNSLREEQSALRRENEKLKSQRSSLKRAIVKLTPDTSHVMLGARMRELGADALTLQRVGSSWWATMKMRDSSYRKSELAASVELALVRVIAEVTE